MGSKLQRLLENLREKKQIFDQSALSREKPGAADISDPPYKDGNTRFTKVPLKTLIKYELVFTCCIFTVYFYFHKSIAQFLLIRNNGVNIRIKHIST